MARGVNKVILVGNIGKDPETRYAAGGTAICTASVAINESWKDKQTGEQKERTEWVRVKFFGRLAEIAGEYLAKGSQVYIEGKLRTEEYEKDGVKRYSTDIIAEEMQMLGGRPEGGGDRQQSSAPRSNQGGASAGSRGPARGPQQAPQRTGAPNPQTGIDDDIPY